MSVYCCRMCKTPLFFNYSFIRNDDTFIYISKTILNELNTVRHVSQCSYCANCSAPIGFDSKFNIVYPYYIIKPLMRLWHITGKNFINYLFTL